MIWLPGGLLSLPDRLRDALPRLAKVPGMLPLLQRLGWAPR
jgi:hypothetical protein